MRSEAVAEVAITYLYRALTSPVMWAMGVAAVLLSALILWNVGDLRAEVGPAVTMGVAAYVASIVSALLAMHVREQFTAARARVVPGYRAVHAGVAVAFAAGVVVGVPLGIAWVCGAWPVGTVAGAACAAGLLWWWMVTQSPWLGLTATAVWFLPFSRQAREAMVWMAGGADPRVGWGLAGLGVVAVASALWRVATLHEGVPAYHRQVGRAALEQRERQGGGWAWGNSVSNRQIERAEAAAGLWGRVRRWEVSFAPQPGNWLMAAMGVAWYLLMAWLESPHGPGAQVVILWSTLAVVPSCIRPWGATRQMPSWEMTLPVGRREFFMEAGASLCGRLLWSWVVTAGSIWVTAILVDPEGARSGAWATVVLLSFAAVALLTGVLAYALRHSEGRRTVEVVVALVVVVSVANALADRAGQVVACAGAAVMLLVGAGVAVMAYHRWLETDLG